MAAGREIQRAPSLPDRLASQLRDDIRQGRYTIGDRLPTEQRLAETYGVSRPIVREAIGRLKQDGLVISRQGAGLFVSGDGHANVFRLQALDFSNRDEIRSIIELLIAVEASASEHAAARRTPEQLELIGDRLSAMQDAIERGEPGVDEDMAFHRAIVDAAGNPFFRDLSDFLDGQVRRFIRAARSNTSREEGLTASVQQEHRAIFEAIADRDTARAKIAAETHLHNAAKRLAIYLVPDAAARS